MLRATSSKMLREVYDEARGRTSHHLLFKPDDPCCGWPWFLARQARLHAKPV